MLLINVLSGEQNFAIRVNSSYFASQPIEDFDAGPLRLDHDGHAQPDGPVHLTGIDITFDDSGKIVTTVSGFDETPFPDVNFTLSITDAFSVSGYQLIVDSRTGLDTDRSSMKSSAGALFRPRNLRQSMVLHRRNWIRGRGTAYRSTVGPGDRGGGCWFDRGEEHPEGALRQRWPENGIWVIEQHHHQSRRHSSWSLRGLYDAEDAQLLGLWFNPIAVPPGATTVSKFLPGRTPTKCADT